MAAAIMGVGAGLGVSYLSKISHISSYKSPRCSVKMTVSIEEKKKSFSLKKSEEAFNVAKVFTRKISLFSADSMLF